MNPDDPRFSVRSYRDKMAKKIAARVARAHMASTRARSARKMPKFAFVADGSEKVELCDRPPKDDKRKLIRGVLYRLTPGVVAKYVAIHANNSARWGRREGLSKYRG